MVDAKLVGVALTIGMVVIVAVSYVSTRSSRGNAVEYTDDWGKRLSFICSEQSDVDGCAISLCSAFFDGDIEETTPLRIDCRDGTSRSASLHDLGNNEDWYERALGADDSNTEAPLYATDEWCANTDGEDDSSGFDLASGDEDNHSCASVVPIVAAAINAEYTRYVTRAHIAYFKSGFDVFCKLNATGVEEGCAEAEFGFGFDSEFEAECEDGQIAHFKFLETVAKLDKLAEEGASEEDITAFIMGHCPPPVEEAPADSVNVVEAPDCVSECMSACIAADGGDACSCAATCNQDNCDNAAKDVIAAFMGEECGGRRLALREMLNAHKSGTEPRMSDVDESRRELGWHVHWPHAHWPHGHNPHGHNPHGHAPNACPGCGNKCGNACFGRCGPGCQKWRACDGDGSGAYRACLEHDYECSCGSSLSKPCMALLWQGSESQRSECSAHSNNFNGGGCEGNGNVLSEMGVPGWLRPILNWIGVATGLANDRSYFINSAVRNWGQNVGDLGNRNNGKACQRVQMCDSHGGSGYGPRGDQQQSQHRYGGPFTNTQGSSTVLNGCSLGAWHPDVRGDRKNKGRCDSWELPWYLNWMC